MHCEILPKFGSLVHCGCADPVFCKLRTTSGTDGLKWQCLANSHLFLVIYFELFIITELIIDDASETYITNHRRTVLTGFTDVICVHCADFQSQFTRINLNLDLCISFSLLSFWLKTNSTKR